MQPIHVLLVGLPAMLGQIVTDILASTPDICVCRSIREQADCGSAIDADHPDVVIVSDDDGSLPPQFEQLLPRYPRMKVLTLRDDGKVSFLFELRRIALGELSPETLVAAIRSRSFR